MSDVKSVIDLTSAEGIEITVREYRDGYRVWINIDGLCRLRAYRVKNISLDQDDDGGRKIDWPSRK